MSHSTKPTVRPCVTTRPMACSVACHTGFRKLIENAPVERTHGIGVLRARLKRNTRLAGCNSREGKTNEPGDRGRQAVTPTDPLRLVE
jgi:hypothetical protein